MLPTVLFMSSRLGLDELAAAEGEQLARQPGGALGGLRDLLRGTRAGVVQIGHRQQRCVAVDDGEDVVEIVRDAAGELADGLHFLRLAQLFLQPPLRRDIAEQTQHEQRPPVDFDKRMGDLQRHRLAVVQGVLPFDFFLCGAGEKMFAMAHNHFRQIFRFGIDDGERLAFQRRRLHPDEFAKGVVDGDDDAVFIGQPHAVHGIFPDGTEKHFGTLQRGLRRAALGDVADVQQQRGLAVVFHAPGADFDRHDACHRPSGFRLRPMTIFPRPVSENRWRASSRRDGGTKSFSAFFPINCSRVMPCNTQPAMFTSSTVPSKSSTKMASGEFSNRSRKRCSLSRNSRSARTRSSAPPHWSASVWSVSKSRSV